MQCLVKKESSLASPVKIKGADFEKLAQSDRMQLFASLFFQLETTGDVLATTLKQWKLMMRKEWRWLGNVVMGEERAPIDNYRKLPKNLLKTMIHSIYGAQQIRSQSLSAIKRLDIGRTNKEQSLLIQKIMITANLRTESYDQFEARCFEMVSKLERKKLKKARTIEESFETDELSQLSSKRRSLANSISKSSYNCYDSASESENSSN